MTRYTLAHLSNEVLLSGLATLVARERSNTADLLAHVAEVDHRRLYLPEGYPSMYEYCVGELKLSEDAAYSRIRVARAARQFPAIFDAIAAGRLHLSAALRLAPHLTPENADRLIEAATHRSKSEIEHLLAERFPRPALPEFLRAVGVPATGEVGGQLVPERVEPAGSPGPEPAAGAEQLDPDRVAGEPAGPAAAHSGQLVPERVEASVAPPAPGRPRITPLAPELYALQVNLPKATHDKLRHAQDLLGHQIPSGDLAQVLDRALELLIAKLEKQKFAATAKPRAGEPAKSANPRHIPAQVKRLIRERDGGRCTFVGTSGRPCGATRRLEFDHVLEVSRGGESTVANLRLRCRAHNQYTAAQALGAELMSARRRAAVEAREKARLRAAAENVAVREAAARVGTAAGAVAGAGGWRGDGPRAFALESNPPSEHRTHP